MAETILTGPALGTGVGEAARAWVGSLSRGLLIGMGLGTAYRAWMRLISTDPEFTWSGTLFIIGSVTVVAVLASLCRTARSRWRRRFPKAVVRLVSGAAFVLVGAGPGMITVPVWLFGGLARGRTDWHWWVRRSLAGLAAAAVVVLAVLGRGDLARIGAFRGIFAVLVFVGLMAAIAALFTWPTAAARRD